MEIESADTKLVTNHINALMKFTNATLQSVMDEQGDSLYLSINHLLELWMVFTRNVIKDQDLLSQAQISFWQDFLLLCKDLHLRLSESISQSNPAIKKSMLLSFVEKFYFMLSQHMIVLIKKIFSQDDAEVELLNRHYITELSKNSFIHIDHSSLLSS